MATREELERAGAALTEAATRVIALAADGVDEHPTSEELEHANAYSATAAMMRRRAAKLRANGDDEHAAYEVARAELFEARATAKRAGLPMPRALRTPAESLARVDEFRRALAALVGDFDDVEPDEWQAFVGALEGGSLRHRTHAESYTAFVASLGRALGALGVEGTDEHTYRRFTGPKDLVR